MEKERTGVGPIVAGASSRKLWRVRIQRLRWRMTISFGRHQFPPAIIRHAVWLYVSRRRRSASGAWSGYLLRNGAATGIEVRAIVRPRTSASTPAAKPLGGISLTWPWPSRGGRSEFGAQSTAKARFSTCSCYDGAELMRKLLKKQGFAPDVLVTDKLRSTARQSPKLDCRLATTRAYARTIGLRIRISRHDGASARCSDFKSPGSAQRFLSVHAAVQTHSTSSAISPPAARSAPSETKDSGRGEPPPRPEHELGLPNSAGLNSVHVTAPACAIARLALGPYPPQALIHHHAALRATFEECRLSEARASAV